MRISVINLTKGKFSDAQALTVIRAVNRQLKEDFEPYWGFGGTLRLEGRSNAKMNKQTVADMRGDAILFLLASTNPADDGSHYADESGVPHGVVYIHKDTTFDDWSLAISHEALELIADPELNLLAMGPHPDPREKKRMVFHWYEMCDAVQTETYKIDGVAVSNFVLPLYFTSTDEYDGRNDFLGTINPDGKTLKSFGVNPGGYVMYYDPNTKRNKPYLHPGDKVAEKKLKMKKKLPGSRRYKRDKQND